MLAKNKFSSAIENLLLWLFNFKTTSCPWKTAFKEQSIAIKDDFTRVPKALLQMLGTPIHVIDPELTVDRKLAQEDVVEVIRHLREQG